VVVVTGGLMLAGLNALTAAALGLALAVAYIAARDRILRVVDGLVEADARERAALQATEQERDRIARDLHDVPLQELASVIRRLDKQETTTEEANALREVAQHLRLLTTSLHPPELDDLGLGAALEHLRDRVRPEAPEVSVELRLDDETGYAREMRPPAEVELAAFRIVQEAVANALKHGAAASVSIEGELRRDAVRLEVLDDGIGLDDGRLRAARRRGRLGMTSMQQRAAVIGARLEIGDGPESGTLVALDWPG
jgi:signal transduction histidine kinase